MEGIKNQLKPPAISEGNAYGKEELKRPPVDMAEALEHFENSEFIRKAFGKDVQNHFINFYRNEITKYEGNVTKWELQRYFDLI
jgi:glutamine synthetase